MTVILQAVVSVDGKIAHAEGWHPESSTHFADGIHAAIGKARELAGEDGIICVCAGDVGGQMLEAGLVDRIALDVAPIVVGEGGKPFFGSYAGSTLLSDPVQVVQGDRVLHVLYDVQGPVEDQPAA